MALQARARWQTAEFQPAPTSQPMLQPPQLSETRPWQMWQRLSRLSGSQETRAARGCFQRLEPKVSSKVARMSSKAPNHRLVGGFNPSEKYESQLGLLFPIYGKIKAMFQTTNQ